MGTRTALMLILCGLGAGMSPSAAAQEGQNPIAPEARGSAHAPDERPLWELLRNGRYRELFQKIERLRTTHPGWNAPEKLLALANEGYFAQRVRQAIETTDHAALIALAAEKRAAFGCDGIDWAWHLGEAYAKLNRASEAEALAEGLISSCADDNQRLATLYKARDWVAAAAWGRLIEREAREHRTPEVEKQYQRLRYGYRLGLFMTAQAQKEPDALNLFESIAGEVELDRDSGVALAGAWEYFNRSDLPRAQHWFERALEWKADAFDAHYGLALCALRDNRIGEADRHLRALPAEYAKRAELSRDVLVARARIAFDAKKYDEVIALLREAETYGPLPRYAIAQQAWSLLNRGDADAAAIFERLHSENPDAESTQGLVHALLARARNAHAAGKFQESADLLRRAQSYAPLPRYGSAQYAWSLLDLGNAAGAAEIFERLYREQPDEEAAQGLVQSYLRAGRDLSSLEPLAQGGPLAAMIRQQDTQTKISRKQFLAARQSDPKLSESLGGAGTPRVGILAAVREKSGGEGTSRLRLTAAPAVEGATAMGDAAELQVRVDRVVLDSGRLADNALVGSAGPGAYAVAPVTRVEGVQPRLFWRMEGDASWEANFGMTPSGGPLPEYAFGGIQRRSHTTWGQYDLAAFAEPVRESILSFVGLRDPYTGATSWGRVLRYGAEARGLWLTLPDWVAGMHLRYEELSGHGVADNEHYVVDGGLGRNLGLRQFDYAVLGIEAGTHGYRRNLSQFTLGHGGYYSPQSVTRAGVAFNFLTSERQSWIASGRLSMGRAYRVQDEAPFFPLAPDGRTYPGSRDYGNDAMIELGAVWSVARQLQTGVLISRSVSPQYNNTIAGLLFRFLFEPRSTTVSTDLPLHLLNDMSR